MPASDAAIFVSLSSYQSYQSFQRLTKLSMIDSDPETTPRSVGSFLSKFKVVGGMNQKPERQFGH